MSDLILGVKEGVVQEPSSAPKASSNKNELGKDAFLQLLVTQMKYQDPLNPNTDTEYIAQLATFSQLEQLQNLSAAANNTQALGLVGKTVILKTESATGGTNYITGKVDYVSMSGTKTQFSVDGRLYNFNQLDTVLGDDYVLEQGRPGVEAVELTFDANEPKDLSFTVKLGEGDTAADDIAVAIGDAIIDPKLVKLGVNKVSISSDVFANLENGSYKLTVGFNDPALTTIKNKITLKIQNSKATTEPDEIKDPAEEPGTTV